ncbi:MAG: hypothetical protein APF76_03585 [Desulfitibacter sp. BRH_c19]|nr:MAG: hypothetical protein APF76_03585 [Desulfitibacter sp. BRH_c19]
MVRFLVGLLIAIFMVSPVNATEIKTEEAPKPELKETVPITAGAVLKEYQWQTSSGHVNINVIEVDLKNPHVQVDVIPGAGKLTQRLNVSAMAKNTGSAAAINGDYYSMSGEGSPLGPMIMGTRLVSSPSKLENIFALGITKDRMAYIEPFTFEGKVSASSGAEFQLSGLNKTIYWEEPVGSHSHANKLHVYSDLWGGKTRGHDGSTTPTEMLVKDGQVVEIVVGEYFDHAVPEGMYILRGHGDAANFMVENFQSGDMIDIQYSIEPNRDWSMIVGGHSLLVNEGKAIPYSRNTSGLSGVRARTAAGISKDGQTLYFVGVERNTPISVGLSLTNLSKFFEEIGAWKALNLDGGGSTTMVSRPLGEWETKRVFEPEQPQERLVVNAIGIYSKAPQGQLKDLIIGGTEILLINEETNYTLKGYDEFYNPVDVKTLPVQWQETGKLGTIEENKFIARKQGATEIKATVNSTNIKIPVQVLGKSDLNTMVLTGTSSANVTGSQKQLQLNLSTKSGESRQVPAHLVDWQVHGIEGHVSPQGVLTIQDTKGSDIGFVVARYQGFSAPLVLQFQGEREVLEFDSMQGISYEGVPQGVLGEISLVNDPENSSGQVTKLAYDFTKGQGTTAAYVRFVGDGIPVDDTTEGFAVSIYGNKGNEWLRAELQDGSGNIHRLDLSSGINWLGWKTLQVSTKDLTKPVSLKRIYLAVPEEQKGQRSLQGSILMKGLTFTYGTKGTEPSEQQVLELTIGQKILKIDGNETEMDVAPVVIEGRTMVPVRFISEALGSSVLWDGDTRNATVIKERRWIDLWPGEDIMVVDGTAVSLDVEPQIMHGRTMLPLRAVAESLDLSIQWDPETKKITLE